MYRYIKNIFNTIICFKRYLWFFSIPHHPTLKYFLHLCKKLVPNSSHQDQFAQIIRINNQYII